VLLVLLAATVRPTGIATAQALHSVAALVPRAAGAKAGDARHHDRFRDLGLPYLYTVPLVPMPSDGRGSDQGNR
jgi:hypothetical protein